MLRVGSLLLAILPTLVQLQDDYVMVEGGRRQRQRHAVPESDSLDNVIFQPIEGKRVVTKNLYMNANSKEAPEDQFKIYDHFYASRGKSVLSQADPFFVTVPPERTTVATPLARRFVNGNGKVHPNVERTLSASINLMEKTNNQRRGDDRNEQRPKTDRVAHRRREEKFPAQTFQVEVPGGTETQHTRIVEARGETVRQPEGFFPVSPSSSLDFLGGVDGTLPDGIPDGSQRPFPVDPFAPEFPHRGPSFPPNVSVSSSERRFQGKFRPSSSFSRNRQPSKPIPLPVVGISEDGLPVISTDAEGGEEFSIDSGPEEVVVDKPATRLRQFLTKYPHLTPQSPSMQRFQLSGKSGPDEHEHEHVIDRETEEPLTNQKNTLIATSPMPVKTVPPEARQRQFHLATVQEGRGGGHRQPTQTPRAFIEERGPSRFRPEETGPVSQGWAPEKVSQKPSLPPNVKLDSCCRKQGLSPRCQTICNFETFDDKTVGMKVEWIEFLQLVGAFLTAQCPGPELGKAFDCASSKADHHDCCMRGGLGQFAGGKCLAFCHTNRGTPSNVLEYFDCLAVFRVIRDCYRNYQAVNPNIFGD